MWLDFLERIENLPAQAEIDSGNLGESFLGPHFNSKKKEIKKNNNYTIEKNNYTIIPPRYR